MIALLQYMIAYTGMQCGGSTTVMVIGKFILDGTSGIHLMSGKADIYNVPSIHLTAYA